MIDPHHAPLSLPRDQRQWQSSVNSRASCRMRHPAWSMDLISMTILPRDDFGA
jgi:hypothetical protein